MDLLIIHHLVIMIMVPLVTLVVMEATEEVVAVADMEVMVEVGVVDREEDMALIG